MSGAKNKAVELVREACIPGGTTAKALQRVASRHGFQLSTALRLGKEAGLLRFDSLHSRWYAAEPEQTPRRRKAKHVEPAPQAPAGDPPVEPAPKAEPEPAPMEEGQPDADEPTLVLPAHAPVRARLLELYDDGQRLLELESERLRPAGRGTFCFETESVRITTTQLERILEWASSQHP